MPLPSDAVARPPLHGSIPHPPPPPLFRSCHPRRPDGGRHLLRGRRAHRRVLLQRLDRALPLEALVLVPPSSNRTTCSLTASPSTLPGCAAVRARLLPRQGQENHCRLHCAERASGPGLCQVDHSRRRKYCSAVAHRASVVPRPCRSPFFRSRCRRIATGSPSRPPAR